MAKASYKIIVSDLHLGFGPHNADGSRNLLEEFHYDQQFAEMLEYYSSGSFARASVTLILNGDILNHLHTTPEDPDCDSLTERVALKRTSKIIQGHPRFFEALSKFAENGRRQIVYIMGNHDFGVAWPKVQQLLRETVHTDIHFYLDCYEEEGIYIEHGNNYFADNRIDFDNLFLTRGQPEPVLKMPWGGFFVIHFINALKRERPYIGKVYPFRLYLRWALFHDTWFTIKTIFRLVLYFLKLNFRRDPRRNFSLFDTAKIVGKFSFPIELDKDAKKLLKKRMDVRFVGFGHTHHARYRQFEPGREYINTGTWTELIGLDVGALGGKLAFTFAEIRIDPKGPMTCKLKEWKGAYREVEEIL